MRYATEQSEVACLACVPRLETVAIILQGSHVHTARVPYAEDLTNVNSLRSFIGLVPAVNDSSDFLWSCTADFGLFLLLRTPHDD